MSLVTLKNFFFGRSTPVDSAQRQPLLGRRRSGSPDTLVGCDIESQTTARDNKSSTESTRRFRVDPRVISDATIGLSDGLTVPFALTAGLSALGQTRVVVYGGFAELIAGAISMGLGGYLGAKSEAASYKETRNDTVQLIENCPTAILSEIREVFEPFDFPKEVMDNMTEHMSTSPKLVDFLMQFQHCMPEPASNRAFTSALTIALGYFLGGLVPLLPYFFVGPDDVLLGLYISIAVIAVALFTFGYAKTAIVCGWQGSSQIGRNIWGGVQMVIVGGASAAAAMGLVKFFDNMAQ